MLAPLKGIEFLTLENFGTYPPGTFPSTWKARGGNEQAAAVYRVTQDGDSMRFLSARADGSSVMIGLDHPFEPVRYPYLQWQWRVRTFPYGSNELSKETNDSAAGVYVVFPGRLPMFPRVLKYVWSASAPVGSRQRSPSYHDAAIIVVASGPASSPEQWRTETVNVVADYEAVFERRPPSARGIGVLTDGDATGHLAEADYANFRLLGAAPNAGPGGPESPGTLQNAALTSSSPARVGVPTADPELRPATPARDTTIADSALIRESP
jgi:hypothetical protein